MKTRQLLSWGRYPRLPQEASAPLWRQELLPFLKKAARQHGSTLAFGNGRSYGDVCLAKASQLIRTRGLNRFIEADWEQGLLTAEAGTTLAEILAVSIPRGWFLTVSPGTQFVTLGGAVANDVHGKNHHLRGCFGNHVRAFGLVRSDRTQEILCSPNQETKLFAATIGGLGLTGILSWVQIQLMPIATSRISATRVRFGKLEEFIEISAEQDARNEFSVSWVDCTATGKRLGRGIYSAGNFADHGPLEVTSTAPLSLPASAPFSLVNKLSVRAFNAAYWHRAPSGLQQVQQDYAAFFYPLDGIANWNRAYGPKGFQQFQCVIPEASHATEAIRDLLQIVHREKAGSFLAVLKRCGTIASPGLLSFPVPGITLALDFAQSTAPQKKLFSALDSVVRNAGGRLYPAKDAHMSGHDFRAAYPDWGRLESLRDPALMSVFWQRVTQ